MKTIAHKAWLSPFVAVAFAVISVTGIMLFFHVKNGSIVVLHEWFGWAFIVAGAAHVLLNVRPLTAYLGQRSARVALVAAVALILVLASAGGLHRGGHHGPLGGAVSRGP